jgi:hypothetical protein
MLVCVTDTINCTVKRFQTSHVLPHDGMVMPKHVGVE